MNQIDENPLPTPQLGENILATVVGATVTQTDAGTTYMFTATQLQEFYLLAKATSFTPIMCAGLGDHHYEG